MKVKVIASVLSSDFFDDLLLRHLQDADRLLSDFDFTRVGHWWLSTSLRIASASNRTMTLQPSPEQRDSPLSMSMQ